jgi:thiamine-phosphate pyrophosphorylase
MRELRGLYAIIDPAACRGRSPVDVTRAVLAGGASLIQWRDKLRDKGTQLADLQPIYELCRVQDAALIVNDHADLPLVLGGDGVHVGQSDLPVAALRRILPAGFVVGASTNNPEEARAAERDGASYIAVGDIFGTGSKQGTRGASPARLAAVKAAVTLPVFGIGGITLANVAEVVRAGADGVAVISAVCAANDPEAAARALVGAIEAARG